ncbi:MAG: di-heme oxidoredictase family protein [Gemmatimonadales bacterium]
MVHAIQATATSILDPPTRGHARGTVLALVAMTTWVAAGCDDPSYVTEAEAITPTADLVVAEGLVTGSPLPGMDVAAFAEGAEAFGEVEAIEDGLGPVFNERSCATCHSNPVVGGSGDQIERRFGRMDAGIFYGYDGPDENHGGTLRQLFSNGTYTVPESNQVCTIPVETQPANANVLDVGRRTTPLFGLGLVDAMPDEFFERLASRQPRAVRGTVSYVRVALPDPRDRGQFIGSRRVARFGWKAGVPSLMQFSADAYTNEMGVTTQSCFRGTSILDFAFESFPNNVAPPEGCNGGDLAPRQPAHADVPEFADDVVGSCAGSLTEIQEDLILFTTFMESLAPPPRDLSNRRAARLGEPLFAEVGCADCHVATTFVTPRRPHNRVPGNYPFHPYSDFLLHDMGTLGDKIGATGDQEARTRLMRTAPLWGARFNTSFLHDGRAPDVGSAIAAHDGQAAAARRRFERLRQAERDAVIAFVLSL